MNCSKRIKEVIMACLGLVMMASCGYWGGRVFHHSEPVPDGWTREDTLSFALPILPEGRDVSVCVDVCYTEKFVFRNLRLLVRHNVVDSLHWQVDTLCCALYDDAGHPLGKGLTGLYQVEVPFMTLRPDGNSSAHVQIMHCMSADSLKGVTDVGVRVSKKTAM